MSASATWRRGLLGANFVLLVNGEIRGWVNAEVSEDESGAREHWRYGYGVKTYGVAHSEDKAKTLLLAKAGNPIVIE